MIALPAFFLLSVQTTHVSLKGTSPKPESAVEMSLWLETPDREVTFAVFLIPELFKM